MSSQSRDDGSLSISRRVASPNRNGVVIRMPDGRELRITVWEWPRGDVPLGSDGKPLMVRLRIDGPRDCQIVRAEIANTPPTATPSQPGDDGD